MHDLIQGWTHFQSGKVRDLYRDADGEILLVASDRISAYDWIMPTAIPDKGAILTKLSLFWFEKLSGITPHHVISSEVPATVKGRAIICNSFFTYRQTQILLRTHNCNPEFSFINDFVFR